MARKCRTPFVEPPNAIMRTIAFSKDFFVSKSDGLIFFSIHNLMASAALPHSRILAGDSAGVLDDPGNERPRASIAVDMVFAVNMPPHAPAPGQAFRSISCRISSLVSDSSCSLFSVL
jgi:hypothetical protein